MEFKYRNYNQLAPHLYASLRIDGVRAPSRNGEVIRLPGVNTLVVDRPWERVNFSPVRDANPFFHLMEAMAMLVPFNSAPFLAHFAKNMLAFTDDGQRYNGFYGERLRQTWGDQLDMIIAELRENPTSRQCVAQIWDPSDLRKKTKDKACNLMLLFSVVDGLLEMTSFNRSNDAVWGIATGANVVHMSFFQEYVANSLGYPMGSWSHVSNNLHVYLDNPKTAALLEDPNTYDLYSAVTAPHVPLMGSPRHHGTFSTVLTSLIARLEQCRIAETTLLIDRESPLVKAYPFLFGTVVPVFNAWQLHKSGHNESVYTALEQVESADWRMACTRWMLRRHAKVGGAK